jgi:hypothetical protein
MSSPSTIRTALFKLQRPRRSGANPGAVMRDARQIPAIAMDQDHATKLQVLSDWNTLLNRREEAE